MRWAATSCRPDTFDLTATECGNRNDLIAAAAFGAYQHFPPTDFNSFKEFDAIFVTMWKVKEPWELRWMDVVHLMKAAGKKVVLHQEAEISWATSRSWEEQKSFYELLGKVDLFLTHNQRDVALWGAFRPGLPTMRWRTCFDLERRINARIEPENKPEKPILFGSSYDSRANGLTGLIACKDFGRPLMHHDRSTGYDGRSMEMPAILGLKVDVEIPHVGWVKWTKSIAPAYIAVHPMPAAAAGRDQITFAALGIPCVGNRELDIQRELFPELCVDCYDVDGIRELVADLLVHDEWYREVRQRALDRIGDYGLWAARAQARTILEVMGWKEYAA